MGTIFDVFWSLVQEIPARNDIITNVCKTRERERERAWLTFVKPVLLVVEIESLCLQTGDLHIQILNCILRNLFHAVGLGGIALVRFPLADAKYTACISSYAIYNRKNSTTGRS